MSWFHSYKNVTGYRWRASNLDISSVILYFHNLPINSKVEISTCTMNPSKIFQKLSKFSYLDIQHCFRLSFANLNFIPKYMYDVCQFCMVEIGWLFRIIFSNIVKLNISFINSPSKMALFFNSVHRNFKSAALYVFL